MIQMFLITIDTDQAQALDERDEASPKLRRKVSKGIAAHVRVLWGPLSRGCWLKCLLGRGILKKWPSS
jgi:hypothetical protein